MLTVAIGKDLLYSQKYQIRFNDGEGLCGFNLEGNMTLPYPGGQIPDEVVNDLIHFLTEYKNRVKPLPLGDASNE